MLTVRYLDVLDLEVGADTFAPMLLHPRPCIGEGVIGIGRDRDRARRGPWAGAGALQERGHCARTPGTGRHHWRTDTCGLPPLTIRPGRPNPRRRTVLR
ncbi:MAG: hypothetical protein ACRDXB_01315, partial [Actinomycetes bacterium]